MPSPNEQDTPRRLAPIVAIVGAVGIIIAAPAMAAQTGESVNTLLRLLGRFHVIVVHAPLTLIPLACIIEVLARILRKERQSTIVLTCLAIGALAAAAAAWMGWVYAELDPPGSSKAYMLFQHRWLGISAAAAGVAALLTMLIARIRRLGALRSIADVLLIISTLLIIITGHLGGSLVHGERFLVEIFDKPIDETAAPVLIEPADDPNAIDFQTQILPVFEARCIECHGPDKAKERLRLHTLANLFAGSKNGPIIVPGSADESELYFRITLPIDDMDVMPNEGDTLTQEQIDLIGQWIDQLQLADVEAVPLPEPESEPEETEPDQEPTQDPS